MTWFFKRCIFAAVQACVGLLKRVASDTNDRAVTVYNGEKTKYIKSKSVDKNSYQRWVDTTLLYHVLFLYVFNKKKQQISLFIYFFNRKNPDVLFYSFAESNTSGRRTGMFNEAFIRALFFRGVYTVRSFNNTDTVHVDTFAGLLLCAAHLLSGDHSLRPVRTVAHLPAMSISIFVNRTKCFVSLHTVAIGAA